MNMPGEFELSRSGRQCLRKNESMQILQNLPKIDQPYMINVPGLASHKIPFSGGGVMISGRWEERAFSKAVF